MQRVESIKDILLIRSDISYTLIIDRGEQDKEIMMIKENIYEKIRALEEFLRVYGLEMRVRVI